MHWNGHFICYSPVLYDIAGCDLCNQNIEKCTALMLAVRNHHTSTVRLLMQNGADLNTTDSKRVTPLYCELYLLLLSSRSNLFYYSMLSWLGIREI